MVEGAAGSAGVLALFSLGAFLVGLSKGGLPMVGMLAVPVLALTISPVTAAALLLPIFVLTDAVSVWLYRRQFSAANLRILIPASLVGVLIGWQTAAWLSARTVGLVIGLLGLGYCANAWLGPRLRRVPEPEQPPGPSRWRGRLWGVVTGFTSFLAHAGAPPYQIYILPQRLPKLVYAGTSTWFFAFVNLAKLPPYVALRPYTPADWVQIGWMVPAALVGTVIGAWATRRLSDRWFFRLVQGGLFAVSLALVVKALRG